MTNGPRSKENLGQTFLLGPMSFLYTPLVIVSKEASSITNLSGNILGNIWRVLLPQIMMYEKDSPTYQSPIVAMKVLASAEKVGASFFNIEK